MSAEILRKAAATLRDHANAANAGPWDVRTYMDLAANERIWEILAPAKDGARGSTIVAETRTHATDPELESAQADFDYLALMFPTVGLLLADLFDVHADALERRGLEYGQQPYEREMANMAHEAATTARAILREA